MNETMHNPLSCTCQGRQVDITRDDPRIKRIRVWPPFPVMHIGWDEVIEPADAPELMSALGLTENDLWCVEGMDAQAAHMPGPSGYRAELDGKPVIRLIFEQDKLSIEKTISANRNWAARQQEKRAKRKRQQVIQARMTEASKPSNGETFEAAKRAAEWKEYETHPDRRLARLEKEVGELKRQNEQILAELRHQRNGQSQK